MKKILIGICGIGNGHVNRQICVIKELLKHNYEILIATQKNKMVILQDVFKNQKIIEITIPWIVCDNKGLNFKETLKKYDDDDLYKKFLEFGIKIEEELNGKPNLVISDYEPNVAQYAYAQQIPLITMEQQSKFIYLEEIKLKNYSIKEEKYRIDYFFPKFEKKIISSFFPLSIEKENIIQVPPIISKLQKGKVDNKMILVYFSSYSDSEKYSQILKILSNIKSYKFKVYTKNFELYTKKYHSDNIEYSNFNDDFKNDLSCCYALITTGGHQLISESISINVPVYVFPLDTYEQNYNAYMVEKYKLGTNMMISKENILGFICNVDEYKKNIKKYKKIYQKNTWEQIFNEIIAKLIDDNE